VRRVLPVVLDARATKAGLSGLLLRCNAWEGGIRKGANDGNDVINMSLYVLDHATPSFAAGSLQPNLVHDFGVIEVGSEPPTFEFEIFNLAGLPDFTAGLELDSVIGTGDVDLLTTDLAPFSGADSLPAGAVGTSFTATLGTGTRGSFAATYTLTFSDEDLPGATALSDLQIMLTGTVDFTRRRQFEVLTGVGSRANLGDGGRTPPMVPEPGSSTLLLGVVLCMLIKGGSNSS
jgi:hypothetical protein